MKYSVDDLALETATECLTACGYGIQTVSDDRGICYASIWTERAFEAKSGQDEMIGGFLVGSLARNADGFCQTFTLTMSEHHNDRGRMAGVLNNILNRKSMR